ncbi:hypothetical protein ACIGH6_16670 [Brachybacterium paraconglomeratum]|uniref:CgeB family protein n=1 Tax=Brachybacterium paraconglomeratum TaxID=173362 RepID=UPI0037C69AFE
MTFLLGKIRYIAIITTALAVVAFVALATGHAALASALFAIASLCLGLIVLLIVRRAERRANTDTRNTRERIKQQFHTAADESARRATELEHSIINAERSHSTKLDDVIVKLDEIEQFTALEKVARGASETALVTSQIPELIDGVTLNRAIPSDAYITLTRNPVSFSLPVNGLTSITIEPSIIVSPHRAGIKSAVIAFSAYDDSGTEITAGSNYLASDTFGTFKYIDARANGDQSIELPIPPRATHARIDLVGWAAVTEIHIRNTLPIRRKRWKPATATPRDARSELTKSTPLSDIPVASITDEFTHNSIRSELTLTPLTPAGWREEMEKAKPRFFFCESAWSGKDSSARPWKGRIYASENFSTENRRSLLDILDYCRREGIPTVFWNKEDPTHYGDRVHDFPATARLFDHVFTTDEACVGRYKADYGLASVHAMPFATQPRIYHPIESGERTDDVVFAGSWYTYHEQRSALMESILDRIIASGRNLVIYDRYHGDPDPNHIYPERFRRFTRPALSHSQLADVYRGTRFGLNFNTVTDSPTMFARRVFELMSTHTLVLSNWSEGTENFFGSSVLHLDREPLRFRGLGDFEIEELRDANLHNVLTNHTYRHRLERLAKTIDIKFDEDANVLTVLDIVDSESELVDAVSRRRKFGSIAKHHVIALSNRVSAIDASRLQTEYGRLGAIVVHLPYLADSQAHLDAVLPSKWCLYAPLHTTFDRAEVASALIHTEYASAPVLVGKAATPRYAWRALSSATLIPRSAVRAILTDPTVPQLLLTLEKAS